MHKIILALTLSMGLLAQQAVANSITLDCSLSQNRYPGIEDNMSFATVALQGLKDHPTGAKKVFTLEKLKLEFWAMNHGIISQNGEGWVMNYQVAIKNTDNGQFLHALSNDRIEKQKSRARISLVAYHDNSMLEAGEIMFECKSE
ncbi:hypothetical protein [Aurantivibrio plasticivorans]